MAEYIERAATVAIADYAEDEHPYDKDPKRPDTYSAYNEGWSAACDYIRGRLEGEPAADVAPVRHGRWEMYFADKYLMCSACKASFWDENGDGGKNYCPHCGAKMDRE